MAAEMDVRPRRAVEDAAGFNEAAANGRGNMPFRVREFMEACASMRPRRMAAEIVG